MRFPKQRQNLIRRKRVVPLTQENHLYKSNAVQLVIIFSIENQLTKIHHYSPCEKKPNIKLTVYSSKQSTSKQLDKPTNQHFTCITRPVFSANKSFNNLIKVQKLKAKYNLTSWVGAEVEGANSFVTKSTSVRWNLRSAILERYKSSTRIARTRFKRRRR